MDDDSSYAPPNGVIFSSRGSSLRKVMLRVYIMCLAIPGQVEQIFEADGVRMGRVNFGGVAKQVCLAYLPELCVGDYAIVHVGFAISKIDERAALETLRTFEQLGMLEDELKELEATGFPTKSSAEDNVVPLSARTTRDSPLGE